MAVVAGVVMRVAWVAACVVGFVVRVAWVATRVVGFVVRVVGVENFQPLRSIPSIRSRLY